VIYVSGSESVGEAEALAEEKDLIVASADEYARTRRVKEIMDAKREVKKAKRSDYSSRSERNARLAEAVADFGSELEHLMEKTELGRDILYEREYLILNEQADPDKVAEIAPGNNGSWGMKTYLDLQGYIQLTERGAEPPEIVHTMRAYRDLNEFLASIGLELDLEEPSKPAQI